MFVDGRTQSLFFERDRKVPENRFLHSFSQQQQHQQPKDGKSVHR